MPNPNEDSELLCRQLLRIVARIRSGIHVEAFSVSINRGGTLTIYTMSVSLEDPPLPRIVGGSEALDVIEAYRRSEEHPR
jgi:hypothetical protein